MPTAGWRSPDAAGRDVGRVVEFLARRGADPFLLHTQVAAPAADGRAGAKRAAVNSG